MTKLLKKYKESPVQFRASFWALICGVLQKGIHVITTPVFTRLLSTSEYGQYGVFNSWLQILTIIVTLNLFAGVFQQGLVKYDEDKDSFASSFQGLTLVLVAIWAAVYFAFRNFWNGILSLTTAQMLLMLLFIWLSAVFGFWIAEQRNAYRYRALVIVTAAVAVLSPVTSIVFIKYAEDKVTAKILGSVLIAFVFYLPLFLIQLKKGKRFFSRNYWQYALSFGIPLIPHYLSQVVLNSSDRIMIERMVDDSSAGIYNLAYAVALIMAIFNTALLQTMSPWFYQRIKAKEITRITPVAYASLIAVAAVNIILILIAPEAVRIFAPPEYYDAIWVIPPVAISVFYMFSYDMFAKFAFYYEKKLFIALASVFAAVANIILNFVFIKRFGYIAAGYTTLACYIIYAAGHYAFMKKVCKDNCGVKPYDGRIILLISFAFTACGLILLMTYNHIVVRYAILAGMIAVALIFRKRITAFAGSFLEMRKDADKHTHGEKENES